MWPRVTCCLRVVVSLYPLWHFCEQWYHRYSTEPPPSSFLHCRMRSIFCLSGCSKLPTHLPSMKQNVEVVNSLRWSFVFQVTIITPFSETYLLREWMKDVHSCRSLTLLGLPAEEQSARYNGLLPPTQSCKYSASLSFICVTPLSLHTHTHTYDICTVTLSDCFSYLLFFHRMGRAPLRMESRLLSRYIASLEPAQMQRNARTHRHTHTHYCRNVSQYSSSLASDKLKWELGHDSWILWLLLLLFFEGQIPSKDKSWCMSSFWAISKSSKGGTESCHACRDVCKLHQWRTKCICRREFNVLNTVEASHSPATLCSDVSGSI